MTRRRSRRCLGRLRASVPTTRGRRCRARRSSASSRARRRSRWPTRPGSRSSTIRRCRRSIREAIANNLDLRVAVARVEEARARAGIAKSFLYPQVDGRRQLRARGRRRTREPDETDDEDTTHQSGDLRLSAVVGARSVRRSGAQNEAALALALASEQGRRGVLVTLVGDVATKLLPAARARLAARDRAPDARPQRRDGHVLSRIDWTAASRTGSRSIASARNRARTAAAIPEIEQQIAIVENAISLLLGRPPGAIARGACCS